MKPPARWTTPSDITERLRKRWDRGRFLTAYARGEHIRIDEPIRGPTAGELGPHYDEVAEWTRLWRDAAQSPDVLVTHRAIGGRKFGSTALPDRFRIDTFDSLCRHLGTAEQVAGFRNVIEAAQPFPALVEWAVTTPMRSSAHHGDFPCLVAAIQWITTNAGSGRRLREIDAPGVDTKFIEGHRALIMELCGLVVDHDLTNAGHPTIEGRYGFATGSRRIRFRMLDDACRSEISGFDDIEVRVDDLARHPLDVDRVFIIENLATYLSLRDQRRAAAVFGGGYAATCVGTVPWLADRDVFYWGDIDTHGFAILDRVRVTLPHARSMLMDRATLLANRDRWGTETAKVDRPLPHLTDDEAALYQDLVEDALGPSVRLEQERIPLPD